MHAADKFDANANTGYATKQEGIPKGWLGLDTGKKSNEQFSKAVAEAKTILWNGWVMMSSLAVLPFI